MDSATRFLYEVSSSLPGEDGTTWTLDRFIGMQLAGNVTVTAQAVYAYAEALASHLTYVRMAGEFMSVPAEHMAQHDLSKLSDIEFPAAAMQFNGGGAPQAYVYAWHHHLKHNPHHWNHWIFPAGYELKGSGAEGPVLAMPYLYCLEMIADWLGSSKAYTGNWDMTEWLTTNIPRIILHSETAEHVEGLLRNLGYGSVLNRVQFAKGKVNEAQ